MTETVPPRLGYGGWGIVAALFAAALWLRLPAITAGLPANRFPDGVKTVDVAYRLARAWKSGDRNLDPGEYQYPTLYTNVVALSCLMTELKVDPERIGRAVAAASSMLAGFAALAIGLRRGRLAGVAAAAFVWFDFLSVRQGRFPTPDALQAALTLGALAVLLTDEWPSLRRWALFGLVGGLSIGTKYTSFFMLFPAAASRLLIGRPERRTLIRATGLAAALTVIGFVVATPSFLWRAERFAARAKIEAGLQQSGQIAMPNAGWRRYLVADEPIPPEAPLPDTWPSAIGWPMLILGLAVAGAALIRPRMDPIATGLAAAAILSIAFLIGASNIWAVRFFLPALLALSVLAAIGTSRVAFIGKVLSSRSPLWPGILASSVIMLPNVEQDIAYHEMAGDVSSQLQAAAWVVQHVPAGATILDLMYGPALPANRFRVLELSLPEYRSELPDRLADVPTVDSWYRNRVDWVIWNSFYTQRFSKPQIGNDEAYAARWRQLEKDLRSSGRYTFQFEAESKLGPHIEIFSRVKEAQ